MQNAIAHHLLTAAQAAIRPSWPTPPCLYTGHVVLRYGIALWLVRVSCPGYAPSQLLVLTLVTTLLLNGEAPPRDLTQKLPGLKAVGGHNLSLSTA